MKEYHENVQYIDINEIDILNRINHINVINAYDTFREPKDECDDIFLVFYQID